MEPHHADPRPSLRALTALGLSVIFSVAGQLLMKWAALRTVGVALDWSLLPALLVALAVYSLAVVNWIFAVRHLPLSIAYPLTSLNYVGILAGSAYWFGEHVSLVRGAGVGLIFLGVLLVAVRSARSTDATVTIPEGTRR